MTLDGFLTFLTLIIAAYGVASSASRLRLRLRLFAVTLISIVGFSLVLYYEMLGNRGVACLARLGSLCRLLILDEKTFPTAGEVAFLVVIVWLLAAWAVLSRRSISPGALPNLRRLVDELRYEQRLAELIQVVEPHLELLASAATRKLWGAAIHDRMRRWRRSESVMELLRRGALEEETRPKTYVERILRALKFALGATIGRILPSGTSRQEAAREILRVLLLSREVIQFIALYRSGFGVKLLGLPDVREVFEFSDEYLAVLIGTSHSTLYAEIKNNQNYVRATEYYFPEENRLLNFLFSDARNAERLSPYKPLGEWLISRLRPYANLEYTTSLNFASDGFEDKDCWEDPTFVVVQFFDLMVSAAEYQDIKWHMWLYYFPHFMDRLTSLYSDDGIGVDVDREWPTRGAYIIYTMFRSMRDWITAVNELPTDSSQLTLVNEHVSHQNDNIPKSAIVALGMCLKTFLMTESIGHQFKLTILNVVLHGIDDLPTEGALSGFRRVFVASVARGGPGWGEVDQEYRHRLISVFQGVDPELRYRLADLRAALELIG